MITGKDKKSMEAIKMLNTNFSHKDIVDKLNISLDNVKRLSRYNNMLIIANKHLSPDAFGIFKNIGTKALVFSIFFKTAEFNLLEELLLKIPANIKRSELDQIAKEVMEIYNELNRQKEGLISELKLEKEQLNIHQNQLKDLQVTFSNNKILQLLKNCDKATRDFLQNYIGIYDNKFALLRRLDVSWQNNLKRLNIIRYNPSSYIWEIEDINGLINSTATRLKQKKPVKFDLNSLSDYQRGRIYKNSIIIDRYKNVKDAVSGARTQIADLEEEIQENKNKIIKHESKIAKLDDNLKNLISNTLTSQQSTNISKKIKGSIVSFLTTKEFYEPIRKQIPIEKIAKEMADFLCHELSPSMELLNRNLE